MLLLVSLAPIGAWGQNTAIIYGEIKDSIGQPISDVNITVTGKKILGGSNEKGYYRMEVPSGMALELVFSYVGRQAYVANVAALNPGEKHLLDIRMNYGVSTLKVFVFTEESEREKVSMYVIDPKRAEALPNVSGSFEQILKTLPGGVKRYFLN